MINKQQYQSGLDYIEGYWPNIKRKRSADCGINIGLPNAFICPSDYWFNGDQFYWDSYFTILGIISSGKIKLAKGMVDNFLYLYKSYGIIPSRNRFYNLGISQPPFLTSMISEIYSKTNDLKWLKEAVSVAEDELFTYWAGLKHGAQHMVYKGLSRYCDHHINHITAEHESGWDMTSRFNNKCLDILPIDLNTLLFTYEKHLSYFYEVLGNDEKKRYYSRKSLIRKKHINELMWNEKNGFFFDYNYVEKKQSNFWSLAGFFPLWAGMASDEQAEKIVKNLNKFEVKGGLATTQKNNLSRCFKQWDYPNGWAPLHYIVINGLLKYGFREDADRIAKKWLDLNQRVFEKTGKFWERYDVVNADKGSQERYPLQWGFGWTNAVFVRLIKELGSN